MTEGPLTNGMAWVAATLLTDDVEREVRDRDPDTPPGGLTAAELHGTVDAMVWARQFRIYSEHLDAVLIRDEGFLVGWFANAIEAGRTAGRQELCPHQDVVVISDAAVLCVTCGAGVKP